mgnify:CR=1 FL=1
MKKIIVTGGLGFIGSNLIELLLKKKYFVINVDKVSYSSNFYNTNEFTKFRNYKFIKCDIKDKKINQILFNYKPSCIFNLAAETHVVRSIDDPHNFIQSNIIGVYNLLENFKIFSKKYKSKLIHVSTDEVYGDILVGRSNEKYPYHPSSPYAASKAASDHLVSSYVRTYNLSAIVTNCSNNYGPFQFPEKLIPHIILSALAGKVLPVYGNGLQVRDWLHVKDHINALIEVVNKGKIGSGGYGDINLYIHESLSENKIDRILARSLSRAPRIINIPFISRAGGRRHASHRPRGRGRDGPHRAHPIARIHRRRSRRAPTMPADAPRESREPPTHHSAPSDSTKDNLGSSIFFVERRR